MEIENQQRMELLPELLLKSEITNEIIKPGYNTSEFWITMASTIIPNLITVLAIFKLVPNEAVSTLSTALVAVVGGIITITVALKYIKSRTELKTKYISVEHMRNMENQRINDNAMENQRMENDNAMENQRINDRTIENKQYLLFNLYDRQIIDKEAVLKEVFKKN